MKSLKDLEPKISRTRLKDILNEITPYTVKQEKKSILEEFENYTKLSKILQPHIDPLNEIEAQIIILKSREISVSDVIEGMIKCQNEECKILNEFKIPIEKIVNTDIQSDILPLGVFIDKEEIYDEKDLDELIIKDYEDLDYLILEQNEKIFKPQQEIRCRKCGSIINTYIDPKDTVSKMSIKGIYNDLYVLSRRTNNSFVDLEKLLPFEREIYINLYKKEIEED
jgi:phage FluMu protein Com